MTLGVTLKTVVTVALLQVRLVLHQVALHQAPAVLLAHHQVALRQALAVLLARLQAVLRRVVSVVRRVKTLTFTLIGRVAVTPPAAM
jgi:hypothetical protein